MSHTTAVTSFLSSYQSTFYYRRQSPEGLSALVPSQARQSSSQYADLAAELGSGPLLPINALGPANDHAKWIPRSPRAALASPPTASPTRSQISRATLIYGCEIGNPFARPPRSSL